MINDIEYMQVVSEFYDLSDYATKKNVLFCNEAKRIENIENIVNSLYNHIVAKSTAIDFGTIPKSHGVVSKVDNYLQIVDCINVIHNLVVSYKEDTKIIDELSTALDNLQKRERTFVKAFTLSIEYPMMVYNSTVLAIIEATSLLITSAVEYIKNGHDSYSMSFDRMGYVKTRESLLYKYIQQFNSICANGELDKLMNSCIKNNLVSESANVETINEAILSPGQLRNAANIVKNNFNTVKTLNVNNAVRAGGRIGKAFAIIAAVSIALIVFLRCGRDLIYYFTKTRMDISDYFAQQAYFLQINAQNLQYRDDPQGDDHKKKVYQKQIKMVEALKKISNIFAIKNKKAEKEAKEEAYNEDRNNTYDDNQDTEYPSGGLF